jgi:isocitrate dehydrogenase
MLPQKFTLCYGDGIGPEITQSVLHIFEKAGVPLSYDVIEVGEKLYLQGISSGIREESWETLLKNKYFLKAPITTPQGGGYKSLNVTIRKTLGLYANIRPCESYAPFVKTNHPKMNVVIVRENEEDLYAGIEHRQTPSVYQCLKLVTHQGSEKIIRYAFEYAKAYGRKKVTCFSKDNIMKLTDGLFHKLFDEIGAEYPELQKEHMIIDIGAARLADTPERFDVIVTLNLYGDIISDIAAQVAGSVGLAGSSNIGEHGYMFEAVHGSAPDIAGKNLANPSGMLMAGVQMLAHMGYGSYAETIHNAWLKTLEDGIHTADIFSETHSKKKVGTKEFAAAVAERLGEKPKHFAPVHMKEVPKIHVTCKTQELGASQKRELVGVDVFVYDGKGKADPIAARFQEALKKQELAAELQMITNRGVKVWPAGREETFCVDHWRCRVMKKGDRGFSVAQVLAALEQAGLDVIKTENLYHYDGKPGYSLGQGQ